MKKQLLILTAGLLLSTGAFAAKTKTISCGFTEPFFSIELDLKTMTLTKSEYDLLSTDLNPNNVETVLGTDLVLKNVSSDPFIPTFILSDKKGNKILKLTYDNKGNDGMSDITFPYSVEYDGAFAGCTTNLLDTLNEDSRI